MIEIETKKADVIALFVTKKETATCSFCGKIAKAGAYADNGQKGDSNKVICFGCVGLATEKLKGELNEQK